MSLDASLLNSYLEETKERVERITSLVLEWESGKSHDARGVLAELHAMKGMAAMSGFMEISDLCHRLEDWLSPLAHNGEELSAPEAQRMLDACDFILLHAQTAAQLEPTPTVPAHLIERVGLKAEEPILPVPVAAAAGPESLAANGVTACWNGETVEISVPEIATSDQCFEVISAMHQVFDRTAPGSQWRVDLSAVDRSYLLLIGALNAFRESLLSRGGSLMLIHAEAGGYTTYYMRRLRECFDVTFVTAGEKGCPS
ncbi:MAG: Hpt domain-containing protein [Candidatus Hydrogenedentales bacterium]|jgi:HPt (histidine-containing phosphotransfer) domain-containing protein